jgi:hypothetical protein
MEGLGYSKKGEDPKISVFHNRSKTQREAILVKFVHNFVSAYFEEDESSSKYVAIQSEPIQKFIGRSFASWDECEKVYDLYGEISHQLSVPQTRRSANIVSSQNYRKLIQSKNSTKNKLYFRHKNLNVDLDFHELSLCILQNNLYIFGLVQMLERFKYNIGKNTNAAL